MLKLAGNRPIRINFDRRSVEIMSPLRRRGHGSYLLGRMVDTLNDELDIQVEHADPVTLRRAGLEKGIEPDKLHHFGANAAKARRKWTLT